MLVRDYCANTVLLVRRLPRQWLAGIRKRAETDFGLSVTGIAGPGGGSEEKPVGLVFIGLASDTLTEHRRFILPGDRHLIRWRASQAALDLLRRRLI